MLFRVRLFLVTIKAYHKSYVDQFLRIRVSGKTLAEDSGDRGAVVRD